MIMRAVNRSKSNDRSGRFWRLGLLLVAIAIYAPVLVVILLSFNVSRYGTLPFKFTFQWYEQLAQDDGLITSVFRSFGLAAAVAVVACVLGTSVALWIVRYARKSLWPITGLLTAAITIPWLILAVATLLLAVRLGSGRGMVTLFLGSLVVVVPYVAFLVIARLQGLGNNLEDAAASLGASPITAFRLVTFPQISSAVTSGTFFAFIITFNNFPVQYFLAPFGFTTLPLEIYTMVRSGYEPNINALATILIVVSLVGALIFAATRRDRTKSAA